jgi:peptidoglycan-N-acetylglucosamine deacetylase
MRFRHLFPTLCLISGSFLGLSRFPNEPIAPAAANRIASLRATSDAATTGKAAQPWLTRASEVFAEVPQLSPTAVTRAVSAVAIPASVPALAPLSPSLAARSRNPNADVQRAWLLAEGPYRDENVRKRLVTFTFDDGPGPHTTDGMLRVLARYEVKATFFLIGRYLKGTSERAENVRAAARHIQEAGHIIGNHSLTHQRLVGLSERVVRNEIEESAREIATITGKAPTFFRPPFGELDDTTRRVLGDAREELTLWSIEAGDMLEDDSSKTARELMGRLEYAAGGMVLLHDVKWSSVKVLDEVLRWLREHRYDPDHPDRVG